MSGAEQRRERLARMRLYLITGDRGDEVETARIVEAALEGGATVIQLRKKSMSIREQYRLALALRTLTRAHEALLIVNDHADLAIAADADGVHLGQDDLPPDAVRALPGWQGRVIGRSPHSLAQAQLAVHEGPDYVAVGPVYPTPTKQGRPAVGTALVSRVAGIIDRPFVAAGRVDLNNPPTAVDAGAPPAPVVRPVRAAVAVHSGHRQIRLERRARPRP